MMGPVIKVEGLSKRYELRTEGRATYTTLRDSLSGIFRSKGKTSEFWALQDLSFEVNAGERVGIIGRNGAGKSTLLKVLSRIVSPTKGRVTLEGRVASLLEVGTGFHPELSGRENIYLNGSILGMSRSEINRHFEAIVDFAGVEKFLDTPVKRYSSGMYVRLAFAVSAHLESEILIVDEVLAVGDSEFQKKCLGKMKEVTGTGRTVLFVSHNMSAIQNLCSKAIYLKQGSLVHVGNTDETISMYLRASDSQTIDIASRTDRSGDGSFRFASISYEGLAGVKQNSLQCGKEGQIVIGYTKQKQELNNLIVSVGIDDEYGQRVLFLSNELTNQVFQQVKGDAGEVCIQVPALALKPGHYSLTLFASVNGEIADWVQDAATMDIEQGDFFGTGKLPPISQGTFFHHQHFSIR
jgi:lipopolysaccharide transport system ATP-binding protein